MGKNVRLEAKGAGEGRKFYTVEIVDVVTYDDPKVRRDGYLVNFTYGAVGGNTRTGTKTPKPVDLATAEKVYADLVNEKTHGSSHYRPVIEVERVPRPNDPKAAVDFIVENLAPPPLSKCYGPRLLNDVDPEDVPALIQSDDWWVQIKYDGDRVQLHAERGEVTLFSARSGLKRECPKALAALFKNANALTVLDGELVGDVFWVFDMLLAEGMDLRQEPYELRYLSLVPLGLGTSRALALVYAATTPEEKEAMILKAREDNQEGVCFLNKNAPYEEGCPSRGGSSLRWKFKASASVIVGKRHATKRSVEALLHGGARIGTIPIPTNREWPPEGAVAEVEYLYCQSSLVQTVYKGLRTDVAPEACTRAQLKFKKTAAA